MNGFRIGDSLASFLFVSQQTGLLLVNSVMILNRRRFLAKYGLDDLNNMHAHGGANPLKAQVVGLLHAVQYLKVRIYQSNLK